MYAQREGKLTWEDSKSKKRDRYLLENSEWDIRDLKTVDNMGKKNLQNV